MNRIRWAPALIILLAMAGLIAWAHTRGGYPDVVYHYRYDAIPTPQGRLLFVNDTWIDPQRRLARLSAHDFSGEQTLRVDEILRDDVVYDLDGAQESQDQQLSLIESQRYHWIEQQLQLGGFQGLAQAFLLHAQGTISHADLYRHQAIRFSTATPYSPSAPGIAWLDSRTHQLLQVQWFIGLDSHTEHFVEQERIAPGTLPADFFEPFQGSHSFWGRMLNWVQGRTT